MIEVDWKGDTAWLSRKAGLPAGTFVEADAARFLVERHAVRTARRMAAHFDAVRVVKVS